MDDEKMWRTVFAMQTHYILRRSFIDDTQRRELLTWARRMAPHLTPNGEARAFNRIGRLPAQPPLVDAIRRRVQDALGLGPDAEPERKFGWYLSIIGEGGAIQPHSDRTPEGTRHLRCNLFLQLPAQGGRPILEAVPLDVEPGDLLVFFASERRHSSEPVIGHRRRILLSFGYTVPAEFALSAL